jgi:hypothetical protein
MQNGKMLSTKKLICKGPLRQVFICLRPRGPPPLTHWIRVYGILYIFTWGQSSAREKVRGVTVDNAGSKITRKVPLQVNFLDDDILLWFLYS